jgi:hypothetical protein
MLGFTMVHKKSRGAASSRNSGSDCIKERQAVRIAEHRLQQVTNYEQAVDAVRRVCMLW